MNKYTAFRVVKAIQSEIDLRVEAEDMICDFCSTPAPEWVAICAPFDIASLPELPPDHSEPDFGLCSECKILVAGKDRPGLLRRALWAHHSLLISDTDVSDMLKDFILRLHEKFWDNFMGNIVPMTVEAKTAIKKTHRMYRGGKI